MLNNAIADEIVQRHSGVMNHGASAIGEARRRVEDAALVQGLGQFVGDAGPADALFIAFLRSDRPHVRLAGHAADSVRAMPGVVAVFGPEDMDGLGTAALNQLLPVKEPPRFPLLESLAASVGQPLMAVVARTALAARDGVEALLPEFTDDGTPLTRDVVDHAWRAGEVSGGARDVSVTVRYDRVAAMPMEPRGIIAVWDGAAMTVWLSTQTPFRARADFAAILGLEEAVIRVIAGDVGGAFGAKASISPEEAVTAFAAHRLRAAVRWAGSREEDLLSGTHGRGGEMQGTACIDDSGRLTGIRARLKFPLGHWLTFSAVVPGRNAARMLPGAYAIDAVDIHLTEHIEARAPVGIYRGAGRPESIMLMERLMDEAAHRLDLDPLDLRRRHVRNAASLPGPTPTGETLDSGDFAGLLEEAARRFGYADLRAEQKRRRERGEIFGLGICLYVEPCGQGWESAVLELLPGGRFAVATGSTAQGQGRLTAAAQTAAGILGIAADRVVARCGDTATSPSGIGALGSRCTPIGGSAIMRAAEALIEKARPLAAELLQGEATYRDGAFFNGAARLDWSGLPPLSVELKFEVAGEAWSSGCCMAAVSIAAGTGELKIERLTWVDDAGTVINPLLVEGQLLGGMAQGVGEALLERIVYDADGQLLTGSLMDYALPRADDVPAIDLFSRPVASVMNPLGAKGVGEAGNIAVPPALVNAAVDALRPFGVKHLDMPLTSEKLWRALSGHEARSDLP